MFDKEKMIEALRVKIDTMEKEEFVKFLKDNGIEVEEEPQQEFKEREDGNCPHCGWSCEDEYKHIVTREINGTIFETVKCTKCDKEFDIVYAKILKRSQTTLSTPILIKGIY